LPILPSDIYSACTTTNKECFSLIGLYVASDFGFLTYFERQRKHLPFGHTLTSITLGNIYSIDINSKLKIPKTDVDFVMIIDGELIMTSLGVSYKIKHNGSSFFVPELCHHAFDETKVSHLYIIGYPMVRHEEVLADGVVVTRDNIYQKGLLQIPGLYIANGYTPVPPHHQIQCEKSNINYFATTFQAFSGAPLFDLQAGCIIGSHYASPQNGSGGYAKAVPLNYGNFSIYY